MTQNTLAHRLGTTTHVSPLLMKARRLGLRVPEDLCTLAVQRGCRHYWQGDEPATPLLTQEQMSDEELAMALLCIAGQYDPHAIRCGAAMLGAEGNDPVHIARLAVWERSEAVVRYVAECGAKFEPENAFWSKLLKLMPQTPAPKPGVLPHPTRFVAMTGITRRGRETVMQWVRPGQSAA